MLLYLLANYLFGKLFFKDYKNIILILMRCFSIDFYWLNLKSYNLTN